MKHVCQEYIFMASRQYLKKAILDMEYSAGWSYSSNLLELVITEGFAIYILEFYCHLRTAVHVKKD